MKKKDVLTMILAVLTVVSFAAAYSGGSGSTADPYLIANANDLQQLSSSPSDWASSFKIDDAASTIDASAMSLTPIGSTDTPFSGEFDGNSKTINYSYADELSDWTAGLFGNNTGTIKDLTVTGTVAPEEGVIPLESGWIGGIVALNDGTVSNCVFDGSLTVESSGGEGVNVAIGGVVGGNNGSITDCQFLGLITGDVFNVYVGGIAGSNTGLITGGVYDGSIDIGFVDIFNKPFDIFTTCGGITGNNSPDGQLSDCSTENGSMVASAAYDCYLGGLVGLNSGLVEASSSQAEVDFTNWSGQVGGFAGYNYFGYITESEALADVTATEQFAGNYTGGFAGVNHNADISESYFYGTLASSSTQNTVGLFAGANRKTAGIENSYALGEINMAVNMQGMIVGGFVGTNDEDATVTNSYAVDKVNKSTYFADDETNGGGFAGYVQSGTMDAGFWNYESMGLEPADSVGYGSDAGVFAETTENLKTESTFTDQGWDFGSVWNMSEQTGSFEGYPILDWQEAPDVDTLDFVLDIGWNWISFNVLPTDAAIEDVLADYINIAENGDYIVDQNGKNATYWDGEWFGTLETIEPGEMYKLRSENGGQLTVEGSYVDPATPIELTNGWNWLGYTLSGPADFEDAIANLDASNNDYMVAQNGKNATYWDGDWFGTLDTLEPGEGYLLRVTTPQTFIYSNAAAGFVEEQDLSTQEAPVWEAPVNLSNQMSIYAQIQDAGSGGAVMGQTAGSMLSAWLPNGDISGVTEVQTGPFGAFFSLAAFSNDTPVEGMTLKLYDAGTDMVYEINETFTFESNCQLGTFNSLEIFTIGGATNTYTVTFEAGAHGDITAGDAVQTIEEGGEATAPTITPDLGWIHTGWDTDFTNVTDDLTVTAEYSPETFTVTFDAGDHGTITAGDAVQTVDYGSAAVEPTVTADAGWNHTGWDKTFDNVTEDMTVNAVYEQQTFTVTFLGGDHGTVDGQDIQTVAYGEAANDPSVTPDEGWQFTAWDTDFSNVTEDLTVTAQYEQQTFTVTFDAGASGTITSGNAVQEVVYGESAVSPDVDANTGFIFTDWDTDFSNVTGDLNVNALYDVQTFTVTFSAGEHGTITDGDAVQTVDYGDDAVAPSVTPDEGYTFGGWDGQYTNVTSDRTITALYGDQEFTVTFDAGENGSITGGDAEQTVSYGDAAVEPTITANAGWDFVGWDTAFDNVTSNLTVTAEYNIQTFTVTFAGGAHGTITGGDAVQTVDYGAAAVEPTVTPEAGWAHIGWDTAFDDVTSELTVTAEYEVQTYTVNFGLGDYGVLIDGSLEQTVAYGESAEAPVVMPEYGWKLTGWDPAIDNVTGNITPEAQYEQIDMEAITCEEANIYDEDNIIDELDLQLLAADWLANGDNLTGDIIGNQWVNMWDYSLMSGCWLVTVDGFDVLGLQLVDGWNWVSFNVLPEGAGIEDVLADYNENFAVDGDYIVGQNGLNATYWDGQWYGTLETIEAGKMYKIRSETGSGEQYVNITGQYVDPATAISLSSGWTWMGYTPNQPETSLEAILANLDATNGDYIVAQNGLNATYWDGQWYGTLTSDSLKEGKGYLVKVETAQQLQYGVEPVNMSTMDISQEDPSKLSVMEAPGTWVEPENLSENMAIYAQVQDADAGGAVKGETAGSMLSAWLPNGDIAGVTEVQDGPFGAFFSLSVMSNDTPVEDMELKLYDAGDDMIYDINEDFIFESNGQIGAFDALEVYTIGGGVPTYTVNFNSAGNGMIVAGDEEQEIAEGGAAIEPTVMADPGFEFTGWDVAFDNITEDLTVTAQYSAADAKPAWQQPMDLSNQMQIYAVVEDEGGNAVGEADGSWLSAWSPSGDIAGVTEVKDGPFGKYFSLAPFSNDSPVEDMTLKVFDAGTGLLYDINETFTFEADGTIGSFSEPEVYTVGAGIETWEVSFYHGSDGLITSGNNFQLIEDGGSAVEPTVTPDPGWAFLGWDEAVDNITSDLNVTAQYTDETFNVTFDGGDNGDITAGTVFQTILYGNDATAPTVTADAGWIFVGWDEVFTNVTDELNPTAQYVNEDNMPNWPDEILPAPNFQMDVFAEIMLNGEPWLPQVGSMFAAFDDAGNLLGLTQIDAANAGSNVLFLEFYSDVDIDGDEINFKIFDSGTETEYPINENLIFQDGITEGSGADPVLFNAGSQWYEGDDPEQSPLTWTDNGEMGYTANPLGAMEASYISMDADLTGFNTVEFTVMTDCAEDSYLIFGITDASGSYTVVDKWNGTTPAGTFVEKELTPYKSAGNDVIFHWVYSTGRRIKTGESVWFKNFEIKP